MDPQNSRRSSPIRSRRWVRLASGRCLVYSSLTRPGRQVFRPRTPGDAIDLVSRLLEYTPSSRLAAIEAMCHPFFDELRLPDTTLLSGKPLPALFDFDARELSIRPDLIPRLVPPHAEAALQARGIDTHNFQPIQVTTAKLE